MYYDREHIASKLKRWESFLGEFRLPMWEDIPDLGLYMDQVIVLLTRYLDYLPPEIKEDKVITAAAINNYVRMKVMPEPVKKKYYRVHIAYLIMICTLKQSLSIATLQKLIPTGAGEDEMKEIYNSYALRHRATAEYIMAEIAAAAKPIFVPTDKDPDGTAQTTDLITASAIAGGFAILMAQKLLMLEGRSEAVE